jgi:hypothetical protein
MSEPKEPQLPGAAVGDIWLFPQLCHHLLWDICASLDRPGDAAVTHSVFTAYNRMFFSHHMSTGSAVALSTACFTPGHRLAHLIWNPVVSVTQRAGTEKTSLKAPGLTHVAGEGTSPSFFSTLGPVILSPTGEEPSYLLHDLEMGTQRPPSLLFTMRATMPTFVRHQIRYMM